jgi:hypothetical protein
MDDRQLNLINKVLNNEGDDGLLEFERLGHPAFDEICHRLRSGSLNPRQQVLALRRLARLARQSCLERKEEILDLALERMESDSEIIRSGAVNTGIWMTRILENVPNLAFRPENKPGATPSLRERVKARVNRAAQRGLDPVQRRLAEEFLSDSPEDG